LGETQWFHVALGGERSKGAKKKEGGGDPGKAPIGYRDLNGVVGSRRRSEQSGGVKCAENGLVTCGLTKRHDYVPWRRVEKLLPVNLREMWGEKMPEKYVILTASSSEKPKGEGAGVTFFCTKKEYLKQRSVGGEKKNKEVTSVSTTVKEIGKAPSVTLGLSGRGQLGTKKTRGFRN